ncbi:TetR/AcrR family transcriptional regulator [Nocardia thraciensis]
MRAQTTNEIEAIAIRLLRDGGPGAVTLHAIAREMGMTPAGLYSYYNSRDDLLTALSAQVFEDLRKQLETARDGVPESDAAGRIMAWAQAFRDWAITNPEGFRLIYADAVPGYRRPHDGPAAEAACRVGAGFVGLAAAVWPRAAATQTIETSWSDYEDVLVDRTRAQFPDLPPAVLALALRMWGRMHGLVALEVHGHLTPLTHRPDALYHAEMLDLIQSLYIDPNP